MESHLTAWHHGAKLGKTGVDYRLWSPECRQALAVINRKDGRGTINLPLARDEAGWFSGHDPEGRAGDLYFFRLDEQRDVPDVASRYQPEGIRGPSQVMETVAYSWNCTTWKRPRMRDLVIYELHVGTFTDEGTFGGAISRLNYLRDLGVTAIELMPIAAFPGCRNWGYDVVLPFAPADCYGTPDDLRRLVDAAHEHRIAVLLDVVYNHVCGEPNWFEATSPSYFQQSNPNEWGKCFNFDGAHSAAVRHYFLQNVIYWMEEFRVDGFRLDAIHAIRDASPVHILQEITQAVHARNGLVIAEDNRNEAGLMRAPSTGGTGVNAVWADDFHHVVKMALKPEPVAHFQSYSGTASELAETLEHGWLCRGQEFPYTGKPRGTACNDVAPERFVFCTSNHDQTGNRPLGERLNHLATPESCRAASVLLLLAPYTPMLFMGQEWSASTPFVFFSDHGGKFGARMRGHRREEFKHFRAGWPAESLAAMPDPENAGSFRASKLNWSEIAERSHSSMLALYEECLRLRAEDPVLCMRDRARWKVWAQGDVVFLRYSGDAGNSRLIVVSFTPHPQLVQWPESVEWNEGWSMILSTELRTFGGNERARFDPARKEFHFEAAATLLLAANI